MPLTSTNGGECRDEKFVPFDFVPHDVLVVNPVVLDHVEDTCGTVPQAQVRPLGYGGSPLRCQGGLIGRSFEGP